MPTYANQELQELKTELLNGDMADNFAKNSQRIADMEYSDKVSLASNLIASDSKSLRRAVEALRHHAEKENSFYSILSRGLVLKDTFDGIMDSENLHAADHFLELNADHCDEFSSLINPILQQNSHDIAQRCLMSTDDWEKVGALIKKSNFCFGRDNGIGLKFQNGATVITLLMLFKSDKPTTMFDSKEYNSDLLNEFPQLVAKHLGDDKIILNVAQNIVAGGEPSIATVCQHLNELSASVLEKDPFVQLQTMIETLANNQARNASSPAARLGFFEVSLGDHQKQGTHSMKSGPR